jgi:23S rRNA (adenine2503-C2)-methyltransferase
VSLRNRGGASCFTLRPNCDMAGAMNNDASPTNDHSDNGALPADVMPIPGLSDPMVLPRKPVARADGKRALIGLSKDQLRAALAEIGLPAKQVNMRASQVWHWLYHRGVTEVSAMANIAKDTRALLDDHFVVGRPEVVTAQVSSDGTRKWLLRFGEIGRAHV